MPDDGPFDEVDDILGDIGGMIGDSFDVSGGREQLDGGFDQGRIGSHEIDEVVDDFAVEFIDVVIAGADFAGKVAVQFDEGVDAVVEHFEGDGGHFAKFFGDDDFGIGGETVGAFGDIDGEIGDAFEFGGDFQDGGDASEIDGNRLVESEDFEAILLDLDIPAVDFVVEFIEIDGEFPVGLAEFADGVGDEFFHAGAHGENGAMERLQIAHEVDGHENGLLSTAPGGDHPKRPVM